MISSDPSCMKLYRLSELPLAGLCKQGVCNSSQCAEGASQAPRPPIPTPMFKPEVSIPFDRADLTEASEAKQKTNRSPSLFTSSTSDPVSNSPSCVGVPSFPTETSSGVGREEDDEVGVDDTDDALEVPRKLPPRPIVERMPYPKSPSSRIVTGNTTVAGFENPRRIDALLRGTPCDVRFLS